MSNLQRAWQGQEKVVVKMQPEQVSAMASEADRRGAWAYWVVVILTAFCVLACGYNAVRGLNEWIRFGQAWTFGALAFYAGGELRRGALRRRAGEECLAFLEREYAARSESYRALQWLALGILPGALASWKGYEMAVRGTAFGGLAPIVLAIASVAYIWWAFGRARRDVAEEWRRVRA